MDKGNPTRKDGGVQGRAVDTIILTYDRATDMLEVGGKANSLDLMLDMLGRATRVVEAKLRFEQAKQLQQELRQAAIDANIAAQVRGGR
jgi:hypothetical protein